LTLGRWLFSWYPITRLAINEVIMDIYLPIAGVSAIFAATLFFLITEKIPVDRTALGIMVALVFAGILTPRQAVAGFANPAVITVAAMFLISRGMIRTGSVGFIAEKVLVLSRGNPNLALIIVLLVVAGASALINNTTVVVLFIPIIMNLTCKYELSPSKYLIPVSYASILAGTCTLIGTSTNIIVSDLSAMHGYGELTMFELSSLGVPIALLGLALIYLMAPRTMPEHVAPVCELQDREDKLYLAELAVPPGSELIGQHPQDVFVKQYPTLKIIEIVRNSKILDPAPGSTLPLAANDILLAKGTATDLVAILRDKAVELPHAEEGLSFGNGDGSLVVELIVPPQSSLLRERLLSSRLRDDPDVHIIAIKSRGLHYTEQKLQNVRLRVGDIILVRCPAAKLGRLRSGNDFIILEDVHHTIIDKRKARWAVAIFGGVVITATSGLADIMACALAGVFLMASTGCVRLKDAYRSLQPDVLLLIVGTIALGSAMEKTGASRYYADGFLGLFQGAGPRWVLAGFILLASISTQVLSNNATAVLILPIAISTALTLGVDPKPFIIGVCLGASACFATPIGYQTNLLVYGPGGYRFSDYLKLGIPLNLLVIVMGAVFIPMIWSFYPENPM
jgi:di/tricarboxylate transporter